jgi:CubicO group peptidase (beta-lactamase class C family)
MKSKFIIFGLCSLFTMSGYTDGQIDKPLQKINLINPNTNQQNWWKEELIEKHKILEAFWNDRIIKYNKKSVDEFKDFIINGHYPQDLIWQKKIEKLFQDAITQQIKFEQFFDMLKELPQELSLTALIQMNAYERLIPEEKYEQITPDITKTDLLNIQQYIRSTRMSVSLTLGDASEKLVTPNFPENLSQYSFCIHSIGKVFTGILTLILIQDGVLTTQDLQSTVQLDAAVIQQLPPSVQAQLKKVTLYQLMTHRSGLGDYLGKYEQKISEGNFPVIKQIADFLPFVEDKTFPLGKEHYSNAGMLLVGLAIEHAYEKKFNKSVSYNDILQQYIIQKVGMPSFSLNKRKDGKYNLEDPVAPHLVGSPAGGYWTTAEDLAKFGQWVYEKSTSDPAFKTLINKYGQEFYHSDNQTIAHFGAIQSSSAVLSVSLKTGATIAILSNQPLGLVSDLNTMIQTHIFSKKLGAYKIDS